MGCPICHRIYCDHTSAQRRQTPNEMMADCNYGLFDGQDPTPEERVERAKDALKNYGNDGWQTAVALVGEEKAAKIRAAL